MLAIKLLGEGFTLVLKCESADAFAFTNSPIAGLMIGTLATALIHSSSTVTSITVAVVGTGEMSIRQGVFVVMGANVGTCVTCMMVAFGQVRDRGRFQRAMAAATIHDMYNIWSVLVMFPVEVIAHPLERLSRALANARTARGAFQSPVDAVVNPLADVFIVVDKKLLNHVASGDDLRACAEGKSFRRGGLLRDANLSDGGAGAVVLTIALVMLATSLLTLVHMLAKVFLGSTKRVISRVLEYNGYVNILMGTAITFGVHSSTVVTSMLTPMAGLGVVTLEQVYPLVLGANLGTTATALLAAMVTGKSDAVAMALVHFFFNLFGIVLFYPIPMARKPIFTWARALALYSASWPIVAIIFLCAIFLIIPAMVLGLVYMGTSSDEIVAFAGYALAGLVGLHVLGLLIWYHRFGGRNLWYNLLERKRVEREIRRYGGNMGLPSFVDDTSGLETPRYGQ